VANPEGKMAKKPLIWKKKKHPGRGGEVALLIQKRQPAKKGGDRSIWKEKGHLSLIGRGATEKSGQPFAIGGKGKRNIPLAERREA